MKNDNLVVTSGLIIALALLASLVALLITHTIAFEQAGLFLAIVAVPLSAMAGLPIVNSALKAPSPEQTQQIQASHSQTQSMLQQAVLTLSAFAQQSSAPAPTPVQPAPLAPPPPAPIAQPVQQVPFPPQAIPAFTPPPAVTRSFGDTSAMPTVQ